MSIKIYFLLSHLNRFPVNLGNARDKQGKRFHQNIKIIKER